jgi:uncharacterized membrane protein YkvI
MANEMSWKKILNYVGAILAFCIGAGFATGQEVNQFFVSYGYYGFAGIIITLILYLYMCSSFMYVGKTTPLKKVNDIFNYYCGNVIGRFFEWYSILLLFLIFIVMLSGSGAVFEEHYGLPNYVGSLLLALLSLFTVIIGFKKLVTIIGIIGPIIVVGCLTVSIMAIFSNTEGISTANEFIATAHLTTASGSWWLSGILYASFMSILLAAFVSAMGASSSSKKEALTGGALGGIVFALAAGIVALALFANISTISDKSIPLLFLANELVPVIGSIYALLLLAGIYTTAAPILWSVCIRFTEDHSKKMYVVAILVTTGAFIASFTPFGTLVNIIYPSSGWLGIVFFVFMIMKQIRNRINVSNASDNKMSLNK